jgi:hypothetical protein
MGNTHEIPCGSSRRRKRKLGREIIAGTEDGYTLWDNDKKKKKVLG